MTVDTERRKKLRNRPRSLIYVELEAGNGGMMRDLSEEGFALRAKMPLRAGQKTQFAFSLAEATRISGEGRIVWIREDGRVAGIEFCGISHSAREQIRRWLDQADGPAAREPKVPAIAVAEPPTREELREEARSTHSRAAPPEPMAQTGQHDILAETARVTVLEPLPREVAIEPLPELEAESDFSKKIDVHRASRFLLTRTIGMVLLMTLIAGAAVFHRELGHALIRLGQIIAGSEEAPAPQSSVTEPPAQVAPVPGTTVPVSPSAVSDGSASSSPRGDRAAPSETQPAATSKVIEVPPILPVTPSSPAKAPIAPVLQPTPQQDLVPGPGRSSGTASDSGQQEYQQAEQILSNRSSEAELAVGVRLLWVAVEKGNVNAEVALAELYRQGKGVARNCDQARILLNAAVRRGSAEAQKHLDELVRDGCE
jgi:hypothetical protein